MKLEESYDKPDIRIKRYLLFLPQPKRRNRRLIPYIFPDKKGEFLAIVGPSGCGKSTLLSIIAGLIPPESGEIHFPSPEEKGVEKQCCPRIGYMLQHDHLFEWRTIYRNVILGLKSITNLLLKKRAGHGTSQRLWTV